MPSLEFKGKQIVYAHHLTVPYRPLVPDPGKSLNPAGADDNLIIHGDNLNALKALLPRYAGKVKCVYIDPPYNTGNKDWVYNDRVNSPLMQQWLKENRPIDNEDLERHDKWLCMMWPRLHILRELLSDDGVIFASIDDHEQSHLRMVMEEVFGQSNFIDTLILIQNLGAVSGKWLSEVNEFIHVFAKDVTNLELGQFDKDEPTDGWLEDDFGVYRPGAGLLRIGLSGTPDDRPNLYFPIYVGEDQSISVQRLASSDTEVWPQDGKGEPAVWRWGKNKVENQSHNLLVRPHNRMAYQFTIKIRPNDKGQFSSKPSSLWNKPQYSASSGTNMMKTVFGGERVFDFPKSVALLKDILAFANVGDDDVILDSFAGSGTTAHAVLALNKEDGGNRKFILVECEDYADSITAERVRRIINGVPDARDTALREGLSGSFTYCTLGDPIDVEGMLTGEVLPSFSALAAYLVHTASGISVGSGELTPQDSDRLFYSSEKNNYHLFYEPALDYLRSDEAILNEERARRIGATARAEGKRAIVFAADKFIGQRELTTMGITFCQLPYEIHLAHSS